MSKYCIKFFLALKSSFKPVQFGLVIFVVYFEHNNNRCIISHFHSSVARINLIDKSKKNIILIY